MLCKSSERKGPIERSLRATWKKRRFIAIVFIVIAYFAAVGASQQEQFDKKMDNHKRITLEDQIIQTNPVLEAFG
ncbi:hypothetical protein DICVIV_14361, partial [Dictyocaulus viviparus]